MSEFNLEKEKRKVAFNLTKSNLENVKAEVVMIDDVSGSAKGLHISGAIEEALKRILPIALNFDDNGELDFFTFSSSDMIAQAVGVTANNYDGYVAREILGNSKIPKWGGTDYEPVLKKVLIEKGFMTKGVFGFGGGGLQANAKSGFPTIIFFLTDGANDDKSATTSLLKQMQEAKTNAYVLFIGVGNSSFPYLEKVADDFDNTGFVSVRDLLGTVGNDSIYDLLLPDELKTWLKVAR